MKGKFDFLLSMPAQGQCKVCGKPCRLTRTACDTCRKWAELMRAAHNFNRRVWVLVRDVRLDSFIKRLGIFTRHRWL